VPDQIDERKEEQEGLLGEAPEHGDEGQTAQRGRRLQGEKERHLQGEGQRLDEELIPDGCSHGPRHREEDDTQQRRQLGDAEAAQVEEKEDAPEREADHGGPEEGGHHVAGRGQERADQPGVEHPVPPGRDREEPGALGHRDVDVAVEGGEVEAIVRHVAVFELAGCDAEDRHQDREEHAPVATDRHG
jgi:hypothetical protein